MGDKYNSSQFARIDELFLRCKPRWIDVIYLFPTFLMRAPEFDPAGLPGLPSLLEELFARAAAVVKLDPAALQTFNADDREASEKLTIQAHYACIIESVAIARWTARRLGPPTLASGYSMGLFSAAAFCGALEFESALELARDACTAAHRALGDSTWATGAVVGFSSQRVRELLAQSGDALEVTDQCGSGTILFTGPRVAVKPILDAALAEGAPTTRLIPVTAPFHTRGLKQIEPQIAAMLERIAVRAPSCPIVSAITQESLVTANDIRAEFCRNISHPMDWQATMTRIMATAPREVVEVGASSVLCDIVRDDHPGECAVIDWRALQALPA